MNKVEIKKKRLHFVSIVSRLMINRFWAFSYLCPLTTCENNVSLITPSCPSSTQTQKGHKNKDIDKTVSNSMSVEKVQTNLEKVAHKFHQQ